MIPSLFREAIRGSIGSTPGASTRRSMIERVMLVTVLIVCALLLLTPGFWAVAGLFCELAFLLAQTAGKILWGVARSLRWVRSRGPSIVPAGVAPALAPARPPHLSPHPQRASQELASERSL